MPQCFKQKGKDDCRKVLKLKKTLFGLRQSPHAFWKFRIEKLDQCSMKQYKKLDPCLFISDTVVCITYVDDLLFWANDEKEIERFTIMLYNVCLDLEQESDAADF